MALRRSRLGTSRTTFPFDLHEENRQRPIYGASRPGVNRPPASWPQARSAGSATNRAMPCAAYVRPRGRWAWAQATATSRGGASRRLIGVSSPEAETIAVSSRRQRVQTKRTSCGDADQLERFTLAAIGQASQCEHDTRNRPGSSIPIPLDSASCPLLPMTILCESFRCLGTVDATSAGGLRAVRRSHETSGEVDFKACEFHPMSPCSDRPYQVETARTIGSRGSRGCDASQGRRQSAQRAPLRVQDVVQVTVVPRSHDLQALTHWFRSRGL